MPNNRDNKILVLRTLLGCTKNNDNDLIIFLSCSHHHRTMRNEDRTRKTIHRLGRTTWFFTCYEYQVPATTCTPSLHSATRTSEYVRGRIARCPLVLLLISVNIVFEDDFGLSVYIRVLLPTREKKNAGCGASSDPLVKGIVVHVVVKFGENAMAALRRYSVCHRRQRFWG